MQNIVVATIKEWNIQNYFKLKQRYEKKYNFHLITSKEELDFENLKKIEPQYIFFPHWSWIIDEKIYNNFECVVFHMTDLPYGRGGSPMQNLLIHQKYDTKITALRVDGGLDTGDIYLKEDFNISCGSAEENFLQLSAIVFEKMIPQLLEQKPVPKKQSGEVVEFKRRKPLESDIYSCKQDSLVKLYDFIRMLDAQDYPKAFIKVDGLKIEFSEVHQKSDKLVGRFEVIEDE